MDVSIIILNYKSKGLIKEQLKHFFSHQTKCSSEVIVVDNNSGDKIGELITKDFPRAIFIQSSLNGGFAAGNNIGIARAQGSYIMIVNPDIVLTADVVDGLYSFMETHPQVGIAGPKLVNPDVSIQYSCLRFPNMWLPLMRRTLAARTKWGREWISQYFMHDWDHASARDVDWLFGACMIVRKSALVSVGNLDSGFFLYLEDTDWCRRFWEHGFHVCYVPSVSVIHLLHRESEGPLLSILFNRTARIHLKSFIRYLWKYRGRPNPHVVKP